MNLFVYLIPALFVVVFIVAAIRKVKVYDSFAEGVAVSVRRRSIDPQSVV